MQLGFVSLMIALLAAAGLYTMKDQVQRLERELRGLEAAIAAERGHLDRLRAEWATLNHPGRLARLARAHLDMRPAEPRQIVEIAEIPFRVDLDLDQRDLRAVLPSGVEVPLRLKPPALLALAPATEGRGSGSQAR